MYVNPSIEKDRILGAIMMTNEGEENAVRRIQERLEALIQQGENIDGDDLEAVQAWINAVYNQLRPFPSEHLSFRLHCLHSGAALLSVARDKAAESVQ